MARWRLPAPGTRRTPRRPPAELRPTGSSARSPTRCAGRRRPAGPASGRGPVGLTADTIRLGTISDVGYTGAPGLNQELFDASDVFAEWCNSLGGINGHKIEIDKLDAKITEYKQRIQEACTQDFALVGRRRRVRRHRPGRPAELPAARLPRLRRDHRGPRAPTSRCRPRPARTPQVSFGICPLPQGDVPRLARRHRLPHRQPRRPPSTTRSSTRRRRTSSASRPSTTTSTTRSASRPGCPSPRASRTRASRASTTSVSPPTWASCSTRCRQIDYKLDWVAGAGNHVRPEADRRRPAPALDTNTVYIQDGTTPFLATDVPAIPQYEQLFDQYLPNGKNEASLGLNSFAAWLLFAQSAKQCGATMTRQCVLRGRDQDHLVGRWRASRAQADPSSQQPGDVLRHRQRPRARSSR